MDYRHHRWTVPGGEALGFEGGSPEGDKGILYVPGFSDYFFQDHLACFAAGHGWRFWAVEPHRWGRAVPPEEIPYHCSSLEEFIPDLEAALAAMASAGVGVRVVLGHSTGGLLALLALAQGRLSAQGIVLNSPFVEFNLPVKERRRSRALLPLAARILPRMKIRKGLSRWYGESLHTSLRGEWDYDLAVKPVPAHATTLGFLAAVAKAQDQVRECRLELPSLMILSRQSWHGSEWSEDVHSADAVLNVEDMKAWAARTGVPIEEIAGARHDVFLSREPARSRALAALGAFLDGM